MCLREWYVECVCERVSSIYAINFMHGTKECLCSPARRRTINHLSHSRRAICASIHVFARRISTFEAANEFIDFMLTKLVIYHAMFVYAGLKRCGWVRLIFKLDSCDCTWMRFRRLIFHGCGTLLENFSGLLRGWNSMNQPLTISSAQGAASESSSTLWSIHWGTPNFNLASILFLIIS